MKDLTKYQGRRLGARYLLGALYQEGKRIGDYEPISNTLVLSKPQSGSSEKQAERVLCSNGYAQLMPVSKMNGAEESILGVRSLEHDMYFDVTFMPPPESVSFLAATRGEEWADEILKFQSEIAGKLPNFKLKNATVPYEDLRKPVLVAPGQESDEDKEYREWYETLLPGHPIQACIVPKTRAIVFVVNKSVQIDWGLNLVIFCADGQRALVSWVPDTFENGYRFAVLSATSDISLSEGIYKIQISLKNAGSNNWGKANDESDASKLNLSAMVRFDIKTKAGDLDIVNLDPISLEESLITQYPSIYAHLLESASKLSDTVEQGAPEFSQDDKAVYEKESYSDPKVQERKTAAEKTLADYALSMDVWKNKSQLAAELLQHDLNETDGRKALRWGIARALHQHLELSPDIQGVISSVFALNDGKSAWAQLNQARKDAVGATIKSAPKELLKTLIPFRKLSQDDINNLSGSWAGKIGVPVRGVELFGKGMQIVDLTSKAQALSKAGHTFFTKTITDAEKAVDDFVTVAEDYFYHLGDRKIENPISFTGLFDFDSAVLKEEIKLEIDQVIPNIIKALESDPGRRVTVSGYTCDIGGTEYNQDLSQKRADAVKAYLSQNGVDQNKVSTSAHGESGAVAPNDSEENRSKNRRVIIWDFSIAASGVYPSREGMGNLERYRSLSVQTRLKVTEEAIAMAGKATDIALGLMSVIPATASIAAGVALAQAGTRALVSVVGALDSMVAGNILKQYMQNKKLELQFSRESSANQALLDNIIRKISKDQSPKNQDIWGAQFRIRAEAIAALVRLLIRASLGSSKDETYETRVKKYQIDAFIHNYILNDGWLYPLDRVATVRMDTYWLYAINEVARSSDTEKQVAHGLDEKNRLISGAVHQDLLKRSQKKMLQAEEHLNMSCVPGAIHASCQMMTLPVAKQIPNHITVDFNKYFPVHCWSGDLINFAKTFDVVHQSYTKASYVHCAMYYLDLQSQEWKPFISQSEAEQHSQRVWDAVTDTKRMMHATASPIWYMPEPKTPTLTPFTPIRVLLVLDVDTIVPLSFRVSRSGLFGNKGPVYKELAMPLTKDKLLASELDKFEGKIGCVFEPFYQVWDKNVNGLKPMAGSLGVGFGARAYYAMGFMSDMEYKISCTIGSNHTTNMDLPLQSVPNKKGEFDGITPTTIRVTVDEKRKGESYFVSDEFLLNRTSDYKYSPLYKGKKTLTTLMRIGTRSPYYITGYRDLGVSIAFKPPANDRTASLFGISPDKNEIKVEKFDWRTQVEFTTVVTCEKLNTSSYLKENAKSQTDFVIDEADWRELGCSIDLFEDSPIMGVSEGPKYSSELIYLGKVTCETSLVAKDQFHPNGREYRFSLDTKDVNQAKAVYFKGLVNTILSEPYKALSILGLDGMDGSRVKTVHVFAASFKPKYENMKGKEVKTIRPFGDVEGFWGGKKEFFECGLNFSSVEGSFVAKKVESPFGGVATYHFSMPKDLTVNVPWVEPMKKEDLEKYKGLFRKSVYDDMAKNSVKEKDLEKWFKNGKSQKFSVVGAHQEKPE